MLDNVLFKFYRNCSIIVDRKHKRPINRESCINLQSNNCDYIIQNITNIGRNVYTVIC